MVTNKTAVVRFQRSANTGGCKNCTGADDFLSFFFYRGHKTFWRRQASVFSKQSITYYGTVLKYEVQIAN